MNEILDETVLISSKQKGAITENRASEMITLSTKGYLTCYTPNSDDDGIDLIVNPKGNFKPVFIQVKSRFNLQKSKQFIQNVGTKTFKADKTFYLLFLYFSMETLEVEKAWLIPSSDFQKLAIEKKEGATYKSFYRFTANPASSKDKWVPYSVEKADLGNKLIEIINSIYQ